MQCAVNLNMLTLKVLLIVITLASLAFMENLLTISSGRSKEKCCNDKTIKKCFGAEVNVDLLLSGRDVEVAGIPLVFNGNVPPHGRVFKSSRGDEAVFTINRKTGNIFGSLKTSEGKSFALEKCRHGHVWIEYDVEMFESMQEPENEDSPDMNRFILPSTPSKATATMSLIVYYTPEFRDSTADIEGFVNQAVAETNQGYVNSQIPLVAEVFCTKEARVGDSDNGFQLLEDFSNSLGTVRALRNSADIAILLVNNSNYCGIASTIHSIPSGNNYAWVLKGCALGYFTFAHEIGHLFGAGHNRLAYPWNPSFPYGHGSLIPNGLNGYRTIMAYSAPNFRLRVNHYSNPDVSYNGIPTGNWKTNNAKVIFNNRFAMAASGGEENNCTLTIYEKPRKGCIKGPILCRVKQALEKVIGIFFPFG